MKRLSICVVSENLSEPVDEGIKHFAFSLLDAWAKEHNTLGLSLRADGDIDSSNRLKLKTNRLFFSYRLMRRIRIFHPDVICYVPSASATLPSFLRARILKMYYPRAMVIMVSLQEREYNWLSRGLIRTMAPDMVLAQSQAAVDNLKGFGCPAGLLPAGVDTNKFVPASAERKAELRSKFGLDSKAFTIVHIGHGTAGRNIGVLTKVRRDYDAQVIFIRSSLRHVDGSDLVARLRKERVVVLEKYFSNIEEIYQLADCYLFPVFSRQACIGIPLSVLEAMACNLPVVSVRFGMLPSYFSEGQGLIFADNEEELLSRINSARSMNGNCHTREKVIPYSWDNISKHILDLTFIESRN